MFKHLRTCPSCNSTKPLRKFWGDLREEDILYISSKCNQCSGLRAVTATQKAQQQYYYYMEILIQLGAYARNELSRKETLIRKGGTSVGEIGEKLRVQGLRPTPQDVEAAWYAMHATRLRRSANWYMHHPVDHSKPKLRRAKRIKI